MLGICYNTLTISGPDEIISEITEKTKNSFLFSTFFPPPENASKDWYKKIWGNDKDIQCINDKSKDNKLKLFFNSTCSPATQFVMNLSKLYKDVTFNHEYHIYDSLTSGLSVFKDGIEIEKKVWGYGKRIW